MDEYKIYRGAMFYVFRRSDVMGSEVETGRPAIIVSNNVGNENAEIVEVVFLTTQQKKPMPTHVEIMCKEKSTALCEQINTISKERLGDYIGTCTREEMAAIDKALLVSLGIEAAVDNDEAKVLRNRLEEERNAYKQFYTKMEIERDTYKQLYNGLVEKIINKV